MRRVLRRVRKAGVADIKLLLVRGESKSVGLDEIIHYDLDVAGLRINPIDIMLFLLGVGFDAFIIAADAVDGIGEPDRTIGGDSGLIRRVQPLAVQIVGDASPRAAESGAAGPSAAGFAGAHASF